jgi:hypothetical protein
MSESRYDGLGTVSNDFDEHSKIYVYNIISVHVILSNMSLECNQVQCVQWIKKHSKQVNP